MRGGQFGHAVVAVCVQPVHGKVCGSMGDVGMFAESGCAVLFNPWDDRPKGYAHHVVEEKDLGLVLELLCERFDLPKP